MARILVIDDEKEFLEFLREFLEEYGYEVVTAENGIEAIQLYKHIPADIVITDLLMPQKDGEETILELQQINQKVKIIVITGGGDISGEDHIQLLESFNVDHAFLKPFNPERLLTVLKESLEK